MDAASIDNSLSYDAGRTDVPLLEETIGANFERTVAAYGEPRGPGRGCDRPALDVSPSSTTPSTSVARGLLGAGIEVGDRVGIWAPNCAEWTLVQYATAKVGAILVNINPAYRTHELAYVLNQSGVRMLVSATDVQDQRLPGDGRRGPAGRARRSSGVVFIGTDDWDDLLGAAAACPPTPSPSGWPGSRPTDPINIQYTSGTTGFPKGATLSHRNILNNGYFVDRADQLHRRRPAVHPGALLPLLRHGDGQPRLHQRTARRW